MRASVLLLLSSCVIALSSGEAPAPAGPPEWEPHIAALTDQRPAVYDPAIESLTRIGEPCLADVAALRSDADFNVRMRVVTVAAGIGGPAALAVIRDLSHDSEWRVRELAALGLGKSPLPGAYERLVELLRDRQPDVRKAAARGLAELGDARALIELADYGVEHDVTARDAMREYLAVLASAPGSVGELLARLASARGELLYALLEASGGVCDPRLSPALAGLLAGSDLKAATLAARSLAANGDSRALEALTTAAGHGYRELSEAAAATLRTLTGHGAGAGPAWALWWRDHAAQIATLTERDVFIADLHDPQRPVNRLELARFTPDELMPLIDGFLGYGARWWPARAYAVIRVDEPTRWTDPLVKRIDATKPGEERLALMILLDELGDPAARAACERLLAQADAVARKERSDGNVDYNHAERVALRQAIERRTGTRATAVEAPAGGARRRRDD